MKKLTTHLCLFVISMGLYACQDPVVTSSDGDLQDNLDSVLMDAAGTSETTGSIDIIEDVRKHPDPNDPCIECSWYFCPTMDFVYQKEYCFDVCEDPPVVVWETECVELLECDPSQYLLEIVDCTTEEGFPGTQQTVCDKGRIKNLECETDCYEEVCDYLDNDCDGVVDNGVTNACGHCEAPAEEICDYIDNDCDGEIDEEQRNACDECGEVPQEVCDSIDNDCDGLVDEELINPCSTACGEGYELCVGGNWVSCNATQPTAEMCNGFDDDCDGLIDEELNCQCPPELIGALVECASPPLTCGKGYKTCVCADENCTESYMTDCAALCVYVPTPGETCEPTLGIPVAENCNNYDDDCDILIDEDLYADCYTGPEGTKDVGICKGGKQYCDAGTWGGVDENGVYHIGLCQSEVTPSDEDICNNADDDCDGIVDKGQEMDPTDILLIIDWSGSMSEEIDAVVEALTIFSSYYADEGALKWGLIIGPIKEPNVCPSSNASGAWGCPIPQVCYLGDCLDCGSFNDMLHACTTHTFGTPCYDALCNFYTAPPIPEKLILESDFSSFSTFISVLTEKSENGLLNTGDEMLLDAIFLSIRTISIPVVSILPYEWHGAWDVESQPELQDFQLNWRDDAEKLIIVFSDEPPQSYLVPQITDSEVALMISSVIGLKPYVFSQTSTEWSAVTNANGGRWYLLDSDTFAMLDSLLEILDENVCQ